MKEKEEIPRGCRCSSVELQASPPWGKDGEDLWGNGLRFGRGWLVCFCFCLHDDYFIIGPDLFLKALQRRRKPVDGT